MIILASKSSRRHKLLKNLKINFKIVDSNFDETSIKIKNPEKYCEKLSFLKANTVSKIYQNDTIIAADTIVCINNKILEKPLNYKEAFNMLKLLSGKIHYVYTGVTILANCKNITFSEMTEVKFFDLTDKEIKTYISNNNPYDKSGSYGIQDGSLLFVDYINGSYENVIGLPISKLYRILLKLNIIN